MREQRACHEQVGQLRVQVVHGFDCSNYNRHAEILSAARAMRTGPQLIHCVLDTTEELIGIHDSSQCSLQGIGFERHPSLVLSKRQPRYGCVMNGSALQRLALRKVEESAHE